MENKFFTKQGWLTPYAHACGYLHRMEVNGYYIALESNNPELNTYQVKGIVQNGKHYHRIWEVFEGIQAARSAYKTYCYGSIPRRYEKAEDIQRAVYA